VGRVRGGVGGVWGFTKGGGGVSYRKGGSRVVNYTNKFF
jgi:hypothetical protein